MINLFHLIEACDSPGTLKVVLFVKKLFNASFIIIPLGLIVFISIDIFRSIISSSDDAKKNIVKSIKRIVFCAFLFVVPIIVNALINVVNQLEIGEKILHTNCWINADEVVIKQKEIANADELVSLAEEEKTYQSISEAQTAVNQVSDKEKRQSYQDRLDKVRDKIENKIGEEKDSKLGSTGR